jgi:glycosyltransferase involved in cell wall biosynthesis
MQKYGGISRYFYELLCEFSRMDDIETKISLIFSNNRYISNNKIINHLNFIPVREFKGKQRLMSFFNKIVSKSYLRKQLFDLFHPTYYDIYFLHYLKNKPFVLTVHDMIHEKFKGMFFKEDKTIQYKKLLIEKATKIIAVSENTKNDLINILNVKKEKIEVVYHGYSLLPKVEKIKIVIPEDYMLFVGYRGGYKNFDALVESVAELLKKNRNLFIICVGGGNFNSFENSKLVDMNIKKQVLQFNADDDTLAYLYKNAIALIFPSLYEGFGMPILEAFSCGCPVICSNSSSFPEVAGDAAKYFNPYDKVSIKCVIEKVVNSVDLRKRMIEKGKKRLENFSWKQTAIKTKKVYEEVLEGYVL